jgi:hypothetical protein
MPSLSFGDGTEKQHRPGWHVGVGGSGAFPDVGAVLGAVGGLDAGGFEELPNESAALGPVVIEVLVRPLAGHQDASPGDAEVFGLVGFALAPSGGQGVSGAVGLDAIEQPHRTPGRAWGDLEFGVQAVGVVAVGVGGVLAEPGRLAYRLRQIFREVSDVAACFFGAAQDSLDVYLGPEPDHVRGLG